MPHQPLLFLHLLPVFISFVFMKSCAGNNNSSIWPHCPASKCGNIEVKYPFWIKSNDTAIQYCGYEGFGLDCTPSSVPGNYNLTLHLPPVDFHVQNINYPDYKLTLVDADVTTNLSCPRPRHNLTLEDLPLNYSTQDLNLTFYFNCTVPSLPFSAYPVDCLKSGGNMSFVSLETGTKSDPDWFKFCEEKVVVTVTKGEIEGVINWNDNGIRESMLAGFVLDWYSGFECAGCENSSGRCGHNDNTKEFLCFCNDGTITHDHCKGAHDLGRLLKVLIGAMMAGVGILSFSIICYRYYKKRKNDKQLEALIKEFVSLKPRRYSYSDIKKMTNYFKEKLGQGGYGEVYRGNLFDKRPVAVKVLRTNKGNGEEFINEVASISKTSHVNVVTLLGFCLDSTKRALIYELMPNGSLDKYIHHESEPHLGFERMHEIAIGIAQGLDYLHGGCNTRILHFDIKPHNILLDEEFCPKISDFGLAKLCARKESIVSMLGARGTIGYIAPEVFSRNFGGVSYKSDVYSYGMMILEMVGGRKNAINVQVSNSSDIYFPHWVYNLVLTDEDLKLHGHTMTKEENDIARKMILVGLWCIQTNPAHRPTMSKVIDMLEGSLESLEVPPKPFLSSPSRSEVVSLEITMLPQKVLSTSSSSPADSGTR